MTSAPVHATAQQGYVSDCQARGAHWARVGRPDYAAHFYASALDAQPEDSRTRMMLADCLARAHQTANAAQHYLRVATDYGAKRRDREAMAVCYQVLHLDPACFVYMAVAPMLRKIGRQSYPLCTRAAEAHLAAGRAADGLDLLRLGAEVNPLDPQAHRHLAQMLLSQHMAGEAVAHLAEAGRLLRSAGNNAKYIEVAEQLLAVDAQHLETLRELPRVYLRVGEPQRAVLKLSDLMRVSPGDTVGFEILAHAFTVIGRTSTALSILQRLVGELTSTGRRPQAEAILERAWGWGFDDPGFASAIAELRQVRSVPAAPRPAPPRPTTTEGTVVLNIADLMGVAEPPPVPEPEGIIDLSDMVEIADGDNTLILRLEDFTNVGPVPPPRPRARPPVSAREAESTQVIDLSDVELDGDVADETVQTMNYGDLTALVHDDDSAELQIGLPPALPSPYRTVSRRNSPPRAPRHGLARA